ncbi:hypothetical protein ACIRCZ_19645 [Leifsonia sp. NPDC102414]|uniref:hypothetical protein n=1 Tax=Leifsonia sp. NPDC102414 TaxID=3364124 RepID=UPI00381BF4C7
MPENGRMQITMDAIGYVRSSRTEVRDDDWDTELASIELDSTIFSPDALLQLDQFSHVEVVYFFDQ